MVLKRLELFEFQALDYPAYIDRQNHSPTLLVLIFSALDYH